VKDHAGHSHDLNVKKVDRVSSTRVRLTVEFSGETVRDHEKAMIGQFVSSARLPGFRPGKAPREMVAKKYRDEIHKELLSHLVEAGIHEAVAKEKLSPVGRPKVVQLGEISGEGNKPFEFQAEFDVHPEIELRNYKGVPLRQDVVVVTEEEIAKNLDSVRERFAVLEPSDAKVPKAGSFVIMEVAVEKDGKREELRTLTIEVGAGRLLPELEKALPEMEVGAEPRAISARYPEDYTEKDLAGKDVVFHGKVLEIKRKTLPPLDDSMAAQLRSGLTVEGLREEIRAGILRSKEEDARRKTRAQILEYLIAGHRFDLPAALVERQMVQLVSAAAEDFRRRGTTLPDLTDKDLAGVRQRAESMVRSSLLLREIALKEKIEIDEERLQRRIREIALESKKGEPEVERLLEEQGVLGQLRDEVLTDQVFEFLVQNATRMENAPQP